MIILQLHEKDAFGLASYRRTRILIAKHANAISDWMKGDIMTKKHFPNRGMFREWAEHEAPGITGQDLLPRVLNSLLNWYESNEWKEVRQVQQAQSAQLIDSCGSYCEVLRCISVTRNDARSRSRRRRSALSPSPSSSQHTPSRGGRTSVYVDVSPRNNQSRPLVSSAGSHSRVRRPFDDLVLDNSDDESVNEGSDTEIGWRGMTPQTFDPPSTNDGSPDLGDLVAKRARRYLRVPESPLSSPTSMDVDFAGPSRERLPSTLPFRVPSRAQPSPITARTRGPEHVSSEYLPDSVFSPSYVTRWLSRPTKMSSWMSPYPWYICINSFHVLNDADSPYF